MYESVIGKRYSKLVVEEILEINGENTICKCQCDCGNKKLTKLRYLRGGTTTSCGCAVSNRAYDTTSLLGKRFGRLVAIKYDHIDKNGKGHWLCQCDCGNIVVVAKGHLVTGSTKSCGCLRKDLAPDRGKQQMKRVLTKYGTFNLSSDIVESYYKMISRCYDPKNPSYTRYHDNNITVDSYWYDINRTTIYKRRDIEGIANFINDMYPSYVAHVAKFGKHNTTLDRIDGELGYCKDNCRWATATVQNNNLSSNRHIYDGEEILTFSECVRKYIPDHLITGSYSNKPGNIIIAKLNRGWSVNQILTMLRHVKNENRIIHKRELDCYMIKQVDQSCVYTKYPNEDRLPGYDEC